MLCCTEDTLDKPRILDGSGTASRMISVRHGRDTSKEYKCCLPGKGFLPYHTSLYNSLIYVYTMYAMYGYSEKVELNSVRDQVT